MTHHHYIVFVVNFEYSKKCTSVRETVLSVAYVEKWKIYTKGYKWKGVSYSFFNVHLVHFTLLGYELTYFCKEMR